MFKYDLSARLREHRSGLSEKDRTKSEDWDHLAWIESIIAWINSILALLGRMGYLGAFLAGFLGASIPFFPSYILIPLMATQLNPLIVGVISGLGAGVGQYLHYYIGLGGRHLFSPQNQRRFEKWRERYGKYGAWLIVLLAATPITPDDIIWIPLGLMRYPKAKALMAGIIGKTALSLFYAYAGYYGWPIIDNYLSNWGLASPS